jgi:hypothetical protein
MDLKIDIKFEWLKINTKMKTLNEWALLKVALLQDHVRCTFSIPQKFEILTHVGENEFIDCVFEKNFVHLGTNIQFKPFKWDKVIVYLILNLNITENKKLDFTKNLRKITLSMYIGEEKL